MTTGAPPTPLQEVDGGCLGPLPLVSARQLRLEEVVLRGDGWGEVRSALGWLLAPLGTAIDLGQAEVLDRAAGIRRPGIIAQMRWPARGTRIGLGIETTIVHALVDRLLGFERRAGEERLQVTPVESGIITYALARSLSELVNCGGPDLVLDRVGPEPFAIEGLGPVVTVLLPVRVGTISGTTRLWAHEFALTAGTGCAPSPFPASLSPDWLRRFGALSATWRAEAGTVAMPRGLGRLRVGGVVPFEGAPIGGSPASIEGPIELVARDRAGRCWFEARGVPLSGGGRVTLLSLPRREPLAREPIPMSQPSEVKPPGVSPLDVPVTLVVELGRINLPLQRVADLKAGDVLELGRHAREPVELTSNGRLVARGELVQIDTELGVRVLSVFL